MTHVSISIFTIPLGTCKEAKAYGVKVNYPLTLIYAATDAVILI